MESETIISEFNQLLGNPESFLSYNAAKSANLKCLLKTIYDLSRKQSTGILPIALPNLIIEDFDTEQIWQQIDSQNNGFLSYSIPHITKYVNPKGSLTFDTESTDEESDVADDSGDNELNGIHDVSDNQDESSRRHQTSVKVNKTTESSDNESGDDNLHIETDSNNVSEETLEVNKEIFNESKQKRVTSTVDDDFFNLQEMEEFLDNEDKKEMLHIDQQVEVESGDSDNETNTNEIDFFAAMSDEDEMEDNSDEDTLRNPSYKDFFVKTDQIAEGSTNKVKRNKYLEELEPQDNKMDNIQESGDLNADLVEKSAFDERQDRLKKKISALENIAVSAKPWQLKGEITADSRPENSLLENVLEFDISTRPAPIITEETTMRLEDIIRQRIHDRAWDSVQRKEKPIEDVREFKKQLVMDGEKSKLSLAQIYEKDYLKQTENDNDDKDDSAQQKEIREIMTSLMGKLDALSNYHFTPKLVTADLKVISHLPAITMEEVASLAVSDAALLTPEEVQRRNKGLAPLGLHERSDTDKKRQRRMKKRKQKVHAQRLVTKGAIAENKYTKEKSKRVLEQLTKEKNVDKMTDIGSKAIKSSTAFFEQLQDQVKFTIKSKLAEKKKNFKTTLQAKKFKL